MFEGVGKSYLTCPVHWTLLLLIILPRKLGDKKLDKLCICCHCVPFFCRFKIQWPSNDIMKNVNTNRFFARRRGFELTINSILGKEFCKLKVAFDGPFSLVRKRLVTLPMYSTFVLYEEITNTRRHVRVKISVDSVNRIPLLCNIRLLTTSLLFPTVYLHA